MALLRVLVYIWAISSPLYGTFN